MAHSDLARDMMVTRLVTLRPEMHVFDGIGRLLKRDITGAPVVDSRRNYLGVFSEKCCMSVLALTARLACEGKKRLVRCLHAKDIMTTRLVTLSPEMDVFEAIALLLRNRISRRAGGRRSAELSRHFLRENQYASADFFGLRTAADQPRRGLYE